MSFGLILTMASGFGQTVFIGTSSDAIKAMLDLSDGKWGFIYGLCTIISALLLTEFGKIVDRFSERICAIIVVLGLALACVGMGYTRNLWILIPALIGLRLFGQGMMGHVAMVSTGRWFASNRGRAVSLVSLGYPLSQALLPAIALLAIPLLGLTQVWVFSALFLVMIIAPSLWMILDRGREPNKRDWTEETTAARDWRRTEVLRLPSFYLLVVFAVHGAFIMTAFFFHQQSLMRSENWPPEVFAGALQLFAMCGVLGALIWGQCIDRWSAIVLLPTIFVPLIIGCLLVFMCDGNWVVFAAMASFGTSLGMSQTTTGAIWPELFGLKYLGEIRATIAPITVLATAIAPFISGYGLDLGVNMGTQLGLMAMSALIFSCLILLRMQHFKAIARNKAG